MIEIFVCDDDETITDFLKFFIMKNFGSDYHVITMNRCNELIGMIQVNEFIPDILIMDINLKDGNGIDTVKEIQKDYPNMRVIYLTGVINYATKIFETNPAYFLVKPINENTLRNAIEKVSQQVEENRANLLILKTNGSEIVVNRRDIIYVESQGRKLIIYRSNLPNIEIYEKMDTIQDQLGSTFIRCHQSFLINMKYITGRTNKNFYLLTGQSIPISKPNLKDVKIKFISYLSGI